MKLEPKEIIETCSQHYFTWKQEALSAKDSAKAKRYMEKAFFWLELQSNLLILWTIEKTMGHDPFVKKKIEEAQVNINKKIVDYASSILEDIDE
ncbi:MAG: hypothetical protein N3E38_01745 [Candidatus Aenigmarchaeota archaeon]|nr:hypothetical protein [Candidatus Aenigmarchaeota archaeon]MCX8179442.1 hypothetical protein [Candidatus Aenigmarchaeota archaeon]